MCIMIKRVFRLKPLQIIVILAFVFDPSNYLTFKSTYYSFTSQTRYKIEYMCYRIKIEQSYMYRIIIQKQIYVNRGQVVRSYFCNTSVKTYRYWYIETIALSICNTYNNSDRLNGQIYNFPIVDRWPVFKIVQVSYYKEY